MSGLAEVLTVGVSFLASGLALVFAGVVLRSDPRGTMNRRLAALLAIDGVFFLGLATSGMVFVPALVDVLYVQLLLLANGAAHLLFAATLETPLVRRLRGPTALRVVWCGAALLYLVIVLQSVARARAGAPLDDSDIRIGFGWPLMAAGSLFALVASIDAFRRTPTSGPVHRRARSFMLAFGTRDVAVAVGILGYGFAEMMGATAVVVWMPVLIATGVVLFVSLLTYGILSSQLFDIDLKIKVGISRSTVATVGIVAVLGALKTVEYSFNRTLGAVAAGLVAGIVLVLAPRLNKLGDKVANTAMPQVQATPEYLSYKKLELYRAALESAHETGELTEKERASLVRLRGKLGLSESDARAMENEVVGAA